MVSNQILLKTRPNQKKKKDQVNHEVKNMKTIIGSCPLVKGFERRHLDPTTDLSQSS